MYTTFKYVLLYKGFALRKMCTIHECVSNYQGHREKKMKLLGQVYYRNKRMILLETNVPLLSKKWFLLIEDGKYTIQQ